MQNISPTEASYTKLPLISPAEVSRQKSMHEDAFNEHQLDSALSKSHKRESFKFPQAKRFTQISAIIDGIPVAMLNCNPKPKQGKWLPSSSFR